MGYKDFIKSILYSLGLIILWLTNLLVFAITSLVSRQLEIVSSLCRTNSNRFGVLMEEEIERSKDILSALKKVGP